MTNEVSRGADRIGIESVEEAVAEIAKAFLTPLFESTIVGGEPSDAPVKFVFLSAHDEYGELDLGCDAYGSTPDAEGQVHDDMITWQGRFCDTPETV
jgi:hypothetical protein